MACLYGTIKDYKWGKMGKRLWVCVLGVLPFLLCLHVGMREEDKKSLTCLVCRLLIFFFFHLTFLPLSLENPLITAVILRLRCRLGHKGPCHVSGLI